VKDRCRSAMTSESNGPSASSGARALAAASQAQASVSAVFEKRTGDSTLLLTLPAESSAASACREPTTYAHR
jgi:hypothetical protein